MVSKLHTCTGCENSCCWWITYSCSHRHTSLCMGQQQLRATRNSYIQGQSQPIRGEGLARPKHSPGGMWIRAHYLPWQVWIYLAFLNLFSFPESIILLLCISFPGLISHEDNRLGKCWTRWNHLCLKWKSQELINDAWSAYCSWETWLYVRHTWRYTWNEILAQRSDLNPKGWAVRVDVGPNLTLSAFLQSSCSVFRSS